ncbi:calcium binding EGF domain protein [Dictyocaulus viviparus]|uniref:Calcium binding EGF domain protein n=1 Tax=Dictyocaulus viviparus TaxID=29172 RepID=A0A0D8Y2B0_DICVI|nr:calcium binding EGF domain protein [Dictyocaulus viviparus]
MDRPCHWLAHCQDTLGSHKCACFPGFHGDGYQCADIDECSMRGYSCPENSECVNLPGTYFCNCTQGFAPKGLPLERCADINECELGLHDCGENQMCQNKVGGFTCVDRCSAGYEFMNGECVDIDECRLQNQCDRRAECINTPGGYECKCDSGLTGDGKQCSPIMDCTQNEDICDRHAFCIKSLKLCFCQSGYAGDGITCNDINECVSMDNACENQKGSRCVNINGGYVCCDENVDDDRCIREHGAFCAGGCGLHAICFNQTCQCKEGFVGDPYTKCLDVNECESNEMCAGVGEWCINKLGGHICCSPNSKAIECQGLHLLKNNDGEIMLQYNDSFGEVLIQEGGTFSKSSGGTIITRQDFLQLYPNSTNLNVNRNNELLCTSYCPAHSECIEGVCRCTEGFGGNPLFGCEDIDECITLSPCPTDNGSWCVNTFGGYHCCNSSSMNTDCIGLAISAGQEGGGLHLTERGKEETFLAASMNETISDGTILHRIHKVQNISGGKIIVYKNKVETNTFDNKPRNNEVGLEIIGHPPEKGAVYNSCNSQSRSTASILETSGSGNDFTKNGMHTETSTILKTTGSSDKPKTTEDVLTTATVKQNRQRLLTLTSPQTIGKSSPEEDKNAKGSEEEKHDSSEITKSLAGNITKSEGDHKSHLGNIEKQKSKEKLLSIKLEKPVQDKEDISSQISSSLPSTISSIPDRSERDPTPTSASEVRISSNFSKKPIELSENDVGLQISLEPTTKGSFDVSKSHLKKSSASIESSGEEPEQRESSTIKGNVFNNVRRVGSTTTSEPIVNEFTERSEGRLVSKESSVFRADYGNSTNTGPAIAGEEVGFEITHNEAATKITPSVDVGLEIAHIETTTSRIPKVIIDGEPFDSSEPADGMKPNEQIPNALVRNTSTTANIFTSTQISESNTSTSSSSDRTNFERIGDNSTSMISTTTKTASHATAAHETLINEEEKEVSMPSSSSGNGGKHESDLPKEVTTKMVASSLSTVQKEVIQKGSTLSTPVASTTTSTSVKSVKSKNLFTSNVTATRDTVTLATSVPNGENISMINSNLGHNSTLPPIASSTARIKQGSSSNTAEPVNSTTASDTTTVDANREFTPFIHSTQSTTVSVPKTPKNTEIERNDGIIPNETTAADTSDINGNVSTRSLVTEISTSTGVVLEERRSTLKQHQNRMAEKKNKGTTTFDSSENTEIETNDGVKPSQTTFTETSQINESKTTRSLANEIVTSKDVVSEESSTTPTQQQNKTVEKGNRESTTFDSSENTESETSDGVKPSQTTVTDASHINKSKITVSPLAEVSTPKGDVSEKTLTTPEQHKNRMAEKGNTESTTFDSAENTETETNDGVKPSQTTFTETSQINESKTTRSLANEIVTSKDVVSEESSTTPTQQQNKTVEKGNRKSTTFDSSENTESETSDGVKPSQTTVTDASHINKSKITVSPLAEVSTPKGDVSEKTLTTPEQHKNRLVEKGNTESTTFDSAENTETETNDGVKPSRTTFTETSQINESKTTRSLANEIVTSKDVVSEESSTTPTQQKNKTVEKGNRKSTTFDSSENTESETSDGVKPSQTTVTDASHINKNKITSSPVAELSTSKDVVPEKNLTTPELHQNRMAEKGNTESTTFDSAEKLETQTNDGVKPSQITVTDASHINENKITSSPVVEVTTSKGVIREKSRITPKQHQVEMAGKVFKKTTIPVSSEDIENNSKDVTMPTHLTTSEGTVLHRDRVSEGTNTESWTLQTRDTFILTTSTSSAEEEIGESTTLKCVSGDQCGDDAYCERRTGVCRCYPGFEGTPPSSTCRDVDECAAGLHKCDRSSRCHNYIGGYACFCPMGYRKGDNGKCVGFFGDGYMCMPIEKRSCTESEWATSNCSKNHVCMVDSNGKKDCNMCKMGFQMKNGECVGRVTTHELSINFLNGAEVLANALTRLEINVNECLQPELNMCDKNANCNNLMGTYACQCKKGFRGDGYMCEDEDECLMSPCHPQAECHNIEGSFECQCPEGFQGSNENTGADIYPHVLLNWGFFAAILFFFILIF